MSNWSIFGRANHSANQGPGQGFYSLSSHQCSERPRIAQFCFLLVRHSIWTNISWEVVLSQLVYIIIVDQGKVSANTLVGRAKSHASIFEVHATAQICMLLQICLYMCAPSIPSLSDEAFTPCFPCPTPKGVKSQLKPFFTLFDAIKLKYTLYVH